MRVLLLFCMVFICGRCVASVADTDSVTPKRSWLGKFDAFLEKQQAVAKFDTTYIVRPDAKWMLKLRLNVSGADIEADGLLNGESYHAELSAALKTTLSMAVTYRGLSLGVAFNPDNLTGKNSDFECNMNAYGNRLGADVIFQSSKTFSGQQWIGGEEVPVEEGKLSQSKLDINVYYVFNSRRFSYPAAFSQSFVQRRSAGSWLLGSSFMGSKIDMGDSGSSTYLIYWGIGGGYGYNYVLPGKWLFHCSALPTFVVLNRSRIDIGGGQMDVDKRFPAVIIVGRGAVVKHFSCYFVGATMVYNFSSMGSEDCLRISNSKWRVRVFWGIRI